MRLCDLEVSDKTWRFTGWNIRMDHPSFKVISCKESANKKLMVIDKEGGYAIHWEETKEWYEEVEEVMPSPNIQQEYSFDIDYSNGFASFINGDKRICIGAILVTINDIKYRFKRYEFDTPEGVRYCFEIGNYSIGYDYNSGIFIPSKDKNKKTIWANRVVYEIV